MFCKDFIISILFPVRCIGCGVFDTWLCDLCADRITQSENRATLLQFHRYVIRTYTVTDYHEPLVKEMISALKFKFAYTLSDRMGEMMALKITEAKKYFPNLAFDFIIPVPLAPRRERWRGFNQSALLARSCAQHIAGVVDESIIHRVRVTHPQTMLSITNRRKNVRDAFKVDSKKDLFGKRILLIDDVVTTGATVNECAKILVRAGVTEVWVLAFAHG